MGTTLSTPGMEMRAWSWVLPRSSPTAPMTVFSTPRMTCVLYPMAFTRPITSSTCPSVDLPFMTMIIPVSFVSCQMKNGPFRFLPGGPFHP